MARRGWRPRSCRSDGRSAGRKIRATWRGLIVQCSCVRRTIKSRQSKTDCRETGKSGVWTINEDRRFSLRPLIFNRATRFLYRAEPGGSLSSWSEDQAIELARPLSGRISNGCGNDGTADLVFGEGQRGIYPIAAGQVGRFLQHIRAAGPSEANAA